MFSFQQIVDCDLSFLHISQQEFLRKLMKEDSGDDTAIVEFLQERLQDQQIKGKMKLIFYL